MPGHWGDEENPWLDYLHTLLKVQKGAKRRLVDCDFVHRHTPPADHHAVDAKGGAAMAQSGTSDEFANASKGSHKRIP